MDASQRRDHPHAVLTIEDEPKIARTIARRLKQDGFAVDVVSDAATGMEHLSQHVYGSVILDTTLPDGDGFSTCRHMRAMGIKAPILLISPHRRIADRVRGLDAGADDYVTKPFATSELSARIRALFRRSGLFNAHRLVVADLTLDPVTRKVTRGKQEIDLTPKEFALLEFLMRQAGRPVTRRLIAEHVWGVHWDRRTNVIDVVISNLRKKIELPARRRLLGPVRGVGYILGAPGPAHGGGR